MFYSIFVSRMLPSADLQKFIYVALPCAALCPANSVCQVLSGLQLYLFNSGCIPRFPLPATRPGKSLQVISWCNCKAHPSLSNSYPSLPAILSVLKTMCHSFCQYLGYFRWVDKSSPCCPRYKAEVSSLSY